MHSKQLERRDSNARELAKRTILTFLVITKDLVLSEKDPQSSWETEMHTSDMMRIRKSGYNCWPDKRES